MAKQKKSPTKTFEFPNSAADQRFRGNPFERLLILMFYQQMKRPDYEERPSSLVSRLSMAWSEQLSLAQDKVHLAKTISRGRRHGEIVSLESMMPLCDRMPERWSVEQISDTLKAWNARSGSTGSEKAREVPFKRRSVAELCSDISRIAVEDVLLARLPRIELEDLSFVLAAGRHALRDNAGFSPDQIDRLEADPELCTALCRLAFGGPTELSCIDVMSFSHRIVHCSSESSTLQASILDLDARPLSATDFWRDVEYCEPAKAEEVFSQLSMAALALRSPQHYSSARDALLAVTDTRPNSSWDRLPPHGDVSFASKPGAVPRRQSGVPVRRGSAIQVFSQFSDVLTWRSMSAMLGRSVNGETCGLKAVEVLITESKARAANAPRAVSAALIQLADRIDLHREISCSFASLVAKGFSSLPENPLPEDFLPGYFEALEALPAKSRVGVAISGDPMAKIASEASRIFGFDSETPNALVGEARKALLNVSGLSPAAWRSLASAPELAVEFEKMMRLSKPRSAFSRGVSKKIEEVMAAADAGDSAAYGRLRRVSSQEDRMLPVEAAANALSASAMCGLSQDAQTRLLMFLQTCPEARAIASGRLPDLSVSRQALARAARGGDASIGDELLILEGMRAEVAAISSAAPAWIKGMSDRLEKIHAQSLKAQAPGSPPPSTAASLTALSERLADIMDCARKQPLGFWAGLDPKDPFGSAQRQHQAWTQALHEARMVSNPEMRLSWPPLIAKSSIGRAAFVEITSGTGLFDEGKRMSHCVSSYVNRCASGGSRIFSGSLAGFAPCTLELAPFNKKGARAQALNFLDVNERSLIGDWRVVQNRGKHNATVSDKELLAGCAELAAQYSKAFADQTLEMIAQKAAAIIEAKPKKLKPPRS